MYTAGLVVRLTTETPVAREALDQLNGAGAFTLGQRQDGLVPVAMEVESSRQARYWHDWIGSLPGVRGVEVVYLHWDEEGKGCQHGHAVEPA
jgi:hypothetical protein